MDIRETVQKVCSSPSVLHFFTGESVTEGSTFFIEGLQFLKKAHFLFFQLETRMFFVVLTEWAIIKIPNLCLVTIAGPCTATI